MEIVFKTYIPTRVPKLIPVIDDIIKEVVKSKHIHTGEIKVSILVEDTKGPSTNDTW